MLNSPYLSDSITEIYSFFVDVAVVLYLTDSYESFW